jgi:phenylacetate-CoA ligase
VFPRIKHAHRTAGFFKIRGINLGHQDIEDFIFRTVEIGDFRAEAMNEGGNDFLKLSIEVRRGCDGAMISSALVSQMKQKFELTPQIAVLETGTLAREFEANVKAARFLDRR